MQDAASIDVAVQPDDRDGACDVVMSDLLSLIEHVQANRQMIGQAIAPRNIAR
jgi:hypothetical protein